MVVFQLQTGFIVVYPPENWLCSSLSPIQILNGSLITENWLYSSIAPIQLLNGSPITENWLYSSMSPL